MFDAAYADALYTEYKNRRIDDAGALAALQKAFAGKTVLVLAPGGSLAAEAGRCRCGSRAGRRDSLGGQLCAGFCDARLCVFHERKTL